MQGFISSVETEGHKFVLLTSVPHETFLDRHTFINIYFENQEKGFCFFSVFVVQPSKNISRIDPLLNSSGRFSCEKQPEQKTFPLMFEHTEMILLDQNVLPYLCHKVTNTM